MGGFASAGYQGASCSTYEGEITERRGLRIGAKNVRTILLTKTRAEVGRYTEIQVPYHGRCLQIEAIGWLARSDESRNGQIEDKTSHGACQGRSLQ